MIGFFDSVVLQAGKYNIKITTTIINDKVEPKEINKGANLRFLLF